jgi:hypothetical protein
MHRFRFAFCTYIFHEIFKVLQRTGAMIRTNFYNVVCQLIIFFVLFICVELKETEIKTREQQCYI